MTTKLQHYLDWVRDAHAMEQQAETMLSGMAERLKHYPSLETRIRQHIEETKQQQKLVKSVIDRHDSTTSTFKDITGKMTAMLQGLGGMVVSDEVVKGTICGYVFEQFEIACYKILISAAQSVGDIEGQRVFETILKQEEAMADWLAQHLPEITQQFLAGVETPSLKAKK